MTNLTPAPITINPLWMTLALPLLRMALIWTGAATAATADSQAGAILPTIGTIAVGVWSLWSWWQQHNKAVALNASPAGSAVVK